MAVHSDSAAPEDGQPNARIFVSYSRKDMAFVDRLEAALRARDFEPLIDRSEIYAFEDWWKRVETLIGRADTVVFVLSPDAVTSDVALKEIEHAASLNKRLAPIVCRQVEVGAVPEALRRLNFIFFDDPTRFEASAEQLAEALHTDIAWIRQHTEFGEQARRWAAGGRPGGLLLRSPMLEVAERWIRTPPRKAPAPTEATRAFITESRRGATWRRRRALVLAGGFAAVMVAVLTAWRYEQTLKEGMYWLADARGHVLTVAREQALAPKETFKECTFCPEMVVLPAGEFMMGFRINEVDRNFTTSPRHKVTIAKPFAVAKFESTFDEWDACSAHGDCAKRISDSGWGRGKRPVIYLSWDDADTYVKWLSRITGKRYRLLSEAEWEYAARAGSTTTYSWGDEIGNGNANCERCGSQWDSKQTAPVGSFAANAFGLHDMHGNVFEWVEDCWHANYDGAPVDGRAWKAELCNTRVKRGGDWNINPLFLRSAHRVGDSTVMRSWTTGFRVGRTLTP